MNRSILFRDIPPIYCKRWPNNPSTTTQLRHLNWFERRIIVWILQTLHESRKIITSSWLSKWTFSSNDTQLIKNPAIQSFVAVVRYYNGCVWLRNFANVRCVTFYFYSSRSNFLYPTKTADSSTLLSHLNYHSHWKTSTSQKSSYLVTIYDKRKLSSLS